jgi:hypothetical protein
VTEQAEQTGQPESYTVKVDRNDDMVMTDVYPIHDGTPVIEVTETGDLWLTRTEDDGDTVTFVAIHARGTWMRVWVEEES